jgi:hypothetical protein
MYPKLPSADCKGDVVLYAQLLKKPDGDYLQFRDIDMKITIGGYHVHLDNLFNGDKFLGNAVLLCLGQVAVVCSFCPVCGVVAR